MADAKTLRDDRPRGFRCWLFRHPWRYSRGELWLLCGVTFKVCTKDGCRG